MAGKKEPALREWAAKVRMKLREAQGAVAAVLEVMDEDDEGHA